MTLTVYLRHAVKKITAKKTEIIDQPRFHADTHSTSQKCPLISSLTPLFDHTNYLALFRSYQRAIIHCQTFSVARGERNAHFSVLAPRLFEKLQRMKFLRIEISYDSVLFGPKKGFDITGCLLLLCGNPSCSLLVSYRFFFFYVFISMFTVV